MIDDRQEEAPLLPLPDDNAEALWEAIARGIVDLVEQHVMHQVRSARTIGKYGFGLISRR